MKERAFLCLFPPPPKVYKGREPSVTTFTAASPAFVNEKFTIAYRDKSPGNRSARPSSAHGGTVDRVARLKGGGAKTLPYSYSQSGPSTPYNAQSSPKLAFDSPTNGAASP